MKILKLLIPIALFVLIFGYWTSGRSEDNRSGIIILRYLSFDGKSLSKNSIDIVLNRRHTDVRDLPSQYHEGSGMLSSYDVSEDVFLKILECIEKNLPPLPAKNKSFDENNFDEAKMSVDMVFGDFPPKNTTCYQVLFVDRNKKVYRLLTPKGFERIKSALVTLPLNDCSLHLNLMSLVGEASSYITIY